MSSLYSRAAKRISPAVTADDVSISSDDDIDEICPRNKKLRQGATRRVSKIKPVKSNGHAGGNSLRSAPVRADISKPESELHKLAESVSNCVDSDIEIENSQIATSVTNSTQEDSSIKKIRDMIK
jgi:hypothetical protein